MTTPNLDEARRLAAHPGALHARSDMLRALADENERLRQLVQRLEAAGTELRASNERWGLSLRRRNASHAWSQAQAAASDYLDDDRTPEERLQRAALGL